MARVARLGLKLVERRSNVEASLWRRFFIEGRQKLRNSLVCFYNDFALSIAKSEFNRRPNYGLEFDDFKQLAVRGLIESVSSFDPLRGSPFEAYARRHIKGAISDGLVKSSEGAAQYQFNHLRKQERLASLLEGNASKTKSTIDKLNNVVVGLAVGLLLEEAAIDTVASDELDPYESLAFNQTRKTVLTQLFTLEDPGRSVLEKHYLKGVAFSQIANSLRVSKGRVSQIHREALDKLKENLQRLDWKPK